MLETYTKKNKDILTVTRIVTETHITEEDRAEIQTKIDHLELDKAEIQERIDVEEAKIAILDS